MKRLLESFFLFLDQFETPEASITFDMDRRSYDWWNEKVWINTLRKDVKIPSNFLPLFDMIINKYGDEIWEGSQSEDVYDEDYYRLTISFKVDQRVMIMTSMITENGEEPAGDSYELNDNEEVNTFLDEHNLDSIMIKYDGGGDSGEIKNVGEGNDGEEYDLSAGMEDVIYTYLERSFGGWENNEGASGEITVTKEEIEINHIWNTRDQVKSDLRLMVELKNVK
jgi:hypothetical protein